MAKEYILKSEAFEKITDALAVEPTDMYTAGKCISALSLVRAADVVEVVRCKDCKHYMDGLIFGAPKFCGSTCKAKKCDDFCSDAERKPQ